MASDPLDCCWRRIGVSGNGSCPKLAENFHCRNCPDFSQAGRRLLDCPAPQGYLSEWTRVLARSKQDAPPGKEAALIFRLSGEWLALPVRRFKEITSVRVVHRLPHRSGGVLLGIVNIRGEIQLCVSLKQILGIEDAPGCGAAGPYKRMAVVEKDKDQWVIPIDEVYGIQRFNLSDLARAPVTIAKAAVKYTRGMLSWQGKSAGFLDEELLFYSLRRFALSAGEP